jgi:hypothetical protein
MSASVPQMFKPLHSARIYSFALPSYHFHSAAVTGRRGAERPSRKWFLDCEAKYRRPAGVRISFKGDLMRSIFRGAVVLGAILVCFASAHATSIVSKTNSSYGENPPGVVDYTSVTNVDELTAGTLLVDTAPPAGFNEEIVCPFSTGCVAGNNDSALFLQLLGTPTPGEQIVLNFGTGVSIDDVSLLVCDPTFVSGTYCMTTAPSSSCSYNSTPGATGQSVTISLPSTAGCIPANLVFSIDENVTVGSSPSFATVGPNVTAPEPASLGLLAASMLPLFGFAMWRSKKPRSQRMSRA